MESWEEGSGIEDRGWDRGRLTARRLVAGSWFLVPGYKLLATSYFSNLDSSLYFILLLFILLYY